MFVNLLLDTRLTSLSNNQLLRSSYHCDCEPVIYANVSRLNKWISFKYYNEKRKEKKREENGQINWLCFLEDGSSYHH